MACSVLYILYTFLLLSCVFPAECRMPPTVVASDEKLNYSTESPAAAATVQTLQNIGNNTESDGLIERNKSKDAENISKDLKTSAGKMSFIGSFVSPTPKGVKKNGIKDNILAASENFDAGKDKLLSTTPFVTESKQSLHSSGDKNVVIPDMTNSVNNDSLYPVTLTYNINNRSVISTEKPITDKDIPKITDKANKVQETHVTSIIDILSSVISTEQSSYNYDLEKKSNVSSVLGQGGAAPSKTSYIDNSTEESKYSIVKEDHLSSLDPLILDINRNNATGSQKNVGHANIDSGTLRRHTSILGNITYSVTTEAQPITKNYPETSNYSQTLFTSSSTAKVKAELVNSSDLDTEKTELFTSLSTTIQKQIESIDITVTPQRSTVTGIVTESYTAGNELKPVLHPRTNIFNEAKTRKEGGKAINSENGGRVIGLDRRRAKMAEGESPTLEAQQEIIDLIKTKVPQEGAINWTTVRDFSHAAWSFHCHVVGIGFIILAVYSIVSTIRLYKRRRLLSRGYFIALNSTMVVMGVLRGIFFLVDPYNANGIFPQPLAFFLLDIGFPCLTSAFSILFMALLQTTRVQLIAPTIQKPKVLAGIIIFHFLISFVGGLIVGLLPQSRPVQLLSDITFVIFSALLAAGYLFIFRKLYRAAQRRQKEMMKLLVRKISSQTGADSATIKVKRKLTLSVAVKVTLAIAILAIIAMIVQIYGMAGPLNVFRTDQPSSWAIWTYITLVRFIELGMCYTMSYVATQPLRFESGGSGPCSRCLHAFCSPCRQIVDCRKRDYDLSEGNLNWSDLHSITNASASGSFRKVSAKESAKSPSEQVGLTSVTNEPKYAKTDNKFGASAYSGMPASFQYDSKQQKVKPLVCADMNSNNDSGVVSHSPSGDGNTLASQHSGKGSRPSSLLINDQGYIRARLDADTEAVPVLYSTDDELDCSSDVGTAFAKAARDKSTPASPKSYDGLTSRGSSEFSFSPPSEINLRQSIEGALDHYNVRLQTPDILSERRYKDSDKFSVASRTAQSADEISQSVSPDLRGQREVRSADSIRNRDLQSWKHARHKKSIENLPYEQIRNENANNNNNWNSSEDLSNSNASLFRHFTFPDGSPLSISLDDLDLPFCDDIYEPRNDSDSRYTFHNSVYNNSDDLAYV